MPKLLTTKMIQHSYTVVLCKNRRQKRNYEQRVGCQFFTSFLA